jgi:hypothetical protein
MNRAFVFSFLTVAQAAFASSPHDPLDVQTPVPAVQPADGPPGTHAMPPPDAPRGREALVVDDRRDSVFFDTTPEGDVWIRGRTYKAHFGRETAQYVPFLGSRAPRNYPIDLRVECVTIGGDPVAFDASAPAVRDGDSIVFERGAFRERFLISAETVEQTFEFDELARRGEIVIRLAYDTELSPASDAEGFTFSNELGHVRYGRASVYHDALDRTAVASRLDGGRIEITAPASLVQGAVGRFVVDPVLETYAVADDAPDQLAADTAYDDTHSYFFTVLEEVFSGTDHDVRITMHYGIGGFFQWTYVDSSSEDWRAPAIANNNRDDQFLVVAARGSAPDRDIWARTVGATQGMLMSSKFLVSDGGYSGDQHSPDVGGDLSQAGDGYYCVVWQRDVDATNSDVHARIIETDGTGLGANTLFVDVAAGLQRNPSISNSSGAIYVERTWNIVWEHEVAPTNRDVRGRQIDFDGLFVGPSFTVASSVLDERNPSATSRNSASSGVQPWMAAYQVQSGANGWDVRCRTFDGTSAISTLDLSELFPTVALDQITPSCDTANSQFVVVWEERPPGVATSTDIRIATLFSLDGALGLNEAESASPGLNVDSRPRVFTQQSANDTYPYALVVFDRDAGGPNDVMATRYEVPVGGPVTVFCAGDGTGTQCPCGNNGNPGLGCASSTNPNGAQLYPWGDARISDDTLLLAAYGMPTTTTVLMFQGTSPSGAGAGTVFGDGLRCAGGSVIRLGTSTAWFGGAQYPDDNDPPVSVKGAIPAAGAVRYYQAWYRNAASFCTASTFNLTNGLRVQWIP